MIYKAVLVDDNKSTVRSLQYSVDWEQCGIELVGVAYDGMSGKELIEKVRPDIIITDIHMPYMDGLSMVEETQDGAENRILIVITGYDKFQYASRAIKLAAFDYILKPIDDNELLDTLTRAVQKLERRHSAENQKKNGIKAMLAAALLNHSKECINAIAGEEHEELQEAYVMIGRLREEPSNSLLERIETLTLFNSGVVHSVVMDGKVILLAVTRNKNDTWDYERKRLWNKFIKLEEISDVGRSTEGSGRSIFGDLYLEAYEDLLRNNKEVQFKNEEHVEFSNVQEEAYRLVTYVDENEDYEQILAKFLMTAEYNPASLQIIAIIFSSQVLKEHKKWSEELNDLSLEAVKITSQDDFISWLMRFLIKIGEIREKDSGISDLVLDVVHYVRNHCLENVKLTEVAELFYVSPNYLSTMIRKETGITFQQHVMNEKMNIAKTLLDDTRMTIDEISAAVGYENYISFYNMFRKTNHMTPREYRLRKGKMNETFK